MVNLEDIGLDDNALTIYTNLTTCCRRSDHPGNMSLGNWKFPNNSDVGYRGTSIPSDFSRNRAKSTIFLHRVSSATGPIGIYTCDLPDTRSIHQIMYFGIYDKTRGKSNSYSHFKIISILSK